MERVKTTWDYVMLLIALLLAGTVFAHYAEASDSNDAMKTCLMAHGYEGNTQLMTFNFSKASACFHDWKVGELREKYIEGQLWLEEHPWYKGDNWDWEDVARKYPGNRGGVTRY